MKPEIRILSEKKLVGKRLTMSFVTNRTEELWRSFMPRRKEVLNAVGRELYSVEVYGPSYFDNFDPAVEFDKWAAVEVEGLEAVPDLMETIILAVGLYAVFTHLGPASEGARTYQYIFGTWLPDSGFLLDNRPHFALMGDKYKSEDPDSEEEIWIPVRSKKGNPAR